MNTPTRSRLPRANAPAQTGADEPAPPASGGRTIVNLLLFVHLFSVALLIVFNGSGIVPDAEEPKLLQPKLRRVPGFYLQLLALDFDFDSGQRYPSSTWLKMHADEAQRHLRLAEDAADPQARKQELDAVKGHLESLDPIPNGDPRLTHRGLFHLTFDDALDQGHAIEFRFQEGGGEQFIRLPSDELGGGQRRIRYEMLAREAARLTRVAESEPARDILTRAVVAHLMQETGVSSGSVAILRRQIQQQPDVIRSERALEEDAWRKDPWHENWLVTVLERNTKRGPDGQPIFTTTAADKLAAPAPQDEKKAGEAKE